MNRFETLIQAYASSDLDSTVVKDWYRHAQPSEGQLCELAENLACAFVAQKINYVVASGFFNQLMPLIGFEKAPRQFWEYYVAFEEFETTNDPDNFARPIIADLFGIRSS